MKCPEKINNICALILTFIICVLFAGTLFGWASLSFVYKNDGIFSHLCEEDNEDAKNKTVEYSIENSTQIQVQTSSTPVSCYAEDRMLSLAFTFSLVAMGLFSFPVGLFFDRFGLRWTRSINAVISIIGYLFLGYASKGSTSWLIFIGGPLIGVSCGTYIMTNTYIAQLAGQFTSSVLLLYSGGINISAAMLSCVKLAADAGFSRQNSMLIMSCLIFIDIINTWVFLPTYKIVKQTDENTKASETNRLKEKESALEEAEDNADSENIIYKPLKIDSNDKEENEINDNERQISENPSFSSCVISSYCFMHFLWFAIINLRLMSFVSDFNGWINTVTSGNEELNSHFINILGIVQFTSICFAPFCGILMDFMRKILSKKNLSGFGRSLIAVPSLAIVSLLTVLLCIIVFVKSSSAVYAGIIISEITRAIAYGTGIAYIEITFPGRHFGKIFGLAYFINGLSVFLQFPIAVLAYKMGYYILACIILTIVTVVSFFHPLNIMWKSRC